MGASASAFSSSLASLMWVRYGYGQGCGEIYPGRIAWGLTTCYEGMTRKLLTATHR
jgi:hypothetical protein